MDFTIPSERFSDEVSGVDIYVRSNIPQSASTEGKRGGKARPSSMKGPALIRREKQILQRAKKIIANRL